MAMPRPSHNMETASAPKSKESKGKPLDGRQKSEEEQTKYPALKRNATAADRIKSTDWIADFKNESPSLSDTLPQDVFGRGVDPEPMPLETNNFVPDALFDYLQSTERQGKGTDTLDKLAKQICDEHQVALDQSTTAEVGQSVKAAPSSAMFGAEAVDAGLDGLLPNLAPLPQEIYHAQTGDTRGESHCSPEAVCAIGEMNEACADQETGQGAMEGEITQSGATKATHAGGGGLMPSNDINMSAPETCTPQLTNSTSESTAPSPLALPSSKAYEPTTGFCEPCDKDVLLGRGGLTNHHAGNKRYRQHADELKPWYESCSTKTEKKELSTLLVEYIHKYGGRFLKRDANDRWREVEQNTARKKASQALREGKKLKTTNNEDAIKRAQRIYGNSEHGRP